MGQKVHPYGFRLGYIRNWNSRWFSRKKGFARLLHEDVAIRKHIRSTISQAGISRVEIERAGKRVRVVIHTARPGIVIGRRGTDIDRLRDELQDMTGKEIFIDIKEIKNSALDAYLVAENIAYQLVKRISFRRAMRKTIENTMQAGAGGIKVACAGRLGGAEMSRREGYLEGKMPLHTLKADIDYGFAEARTTCGIIGVKVWIYKGEKDPDEEFLPERRNKKGGDT